MSGRLQACVQHGHQSCRACYALWSAPRTHPRHPDHPASCECCRRPSGFQTVLQTWASCRRSQLPRPRHHHHPLRHHPWKSGGALRQARSMRSSGSAPTPHHTCRKLLYQRKWQLLRRQRASRRSRAMQGARRSQACMARPATTSTLKRMRKRQAPQLLHRD